MNAKRRWRGWRLWSTVGLLVASAAAFLLLIGSASGVLGGSPSKFESSDGNMIRDTSGNNDWKTVNFIAVPDISSSQSDNSFESGQKQDTPCPVLDTHGNPPKDDFTNIAYLSEVNNTTGDTFLYGATIRYTANGSASENVELNQAPSKELCSGENLYKRVPGDKLIAIDYKSSGPQFNVLTWIDGTDPNNPTCFVSNDSPPCWGAKKKTLAANGAEGGVNASTIAAGDNPIGTGAGAGALVAGQFAEFGINLTQAGIIPAGQCETFNQTVFESRSSGDSFVSTTKDVAFAPNPITNCATIKIHKTGGGKALQGATFGLFQGKNADTSGTPYKSCTTDANGDCSIDQITPGDYTLDETTVPAGYSKASGLPQNVTLAAGDNKSFSFDDPQKAHTIDIVKDPDSQSVASGGTASFTITVKNTGAVALTNVHVDDPNAGGCAKTIGTLAIGASVSYPCTKANVTTGFVNTATACGTAFATDDTCDSDTANVGIESASSTQDFKPTDTAAVTVTGTGVSPPNGKVTFNLYKGTCDSAHLIYGPVQVAVDANGKATAASSDLLSTLVANAITAGKTIAAGTGGSYNWQLSYGNDTHGNAPITGACGTENFSVTNG